ncbi:MAG: hypothetical protein SAJ12_06335 [Jaaginema sp. PMC 1079.18]|nr:hypothetical protein [Jaaginema sp. PMC 1080.18]MEC4850611.1 hypothetical protein [Jaaginema sp. PMC 1079.18]MEC4867713.1 hypothetical protein [Jaaginema sp. PMC 1078.18]
MTTNPKQKTRLLLNLWNLGGTETAVNQGQLNKQVKLSRETSKDYQTIYTELETIGAISCNKVKSTTKITLTEKGLQLLAESLESPEFQYSPRQRVRTKDFNALLNWLRWSSEVGRLQISSDGNNKTEDRQIRSYEEFKPVALAVYDQLNQDYNLDHLIPIYRIRRTIGEIVSRSQFNEWMLEMQANDIIQLIGDQAVDVTLDQLEDSISTKLSGLRFFVKRLDIET